MMVSMGMIMSAAMFIMVVMMLFIMLVVMSMCIPDNDRDDDGVHARHHIDDHGRMYIHHGRDDVRARPHSWSCPQL